MVNINTLNKLEMLEIGCDVDKLENYVKLINYCEIMGNNLVSDEYKEYCVSLLKQLKPNSDIFKYNWDMEKASIDKYDEVFIKHGMYTGNNINRLDKNSINAFVNNMHDTEDIFAYALPDGIDIRIVYVNSMLYKAYTYNGKEKGKDITRYIKNIIPYNIEEISRHGIVDVRARLSMTDISMLELGIKEKEKLNFIANYVTNEYYELYEDKFVVLVYKIFTSDELNLDTLWDEYELLDETDFDTAERVIVRDIDKDELPDAIDKIESHFTTEQFDYTITDINIAINDQFDILSSLEIDHIININEKIKKPKVFSSKILGIKWTNSKHTIVPRVEIKPLVISQTTSLDYINLPSIEYIEKYNLLPNENIYFYIDYTKDIILCDCYGNNLI